MKDRVYEIAKNSKYDVYEGALISLVYKPFVKKTASRVSVNEKVAEELHKPVSKKFKGRKVYVRFKDNVWAADLTVIGSLSSKNKNLKYLVWILDGWTIKREKGELLQMLLWK